MRIAALLALTAGCSRGEIQWPGGRAPLRTAWFQTAEVDGGRRVTIALSTSDFPCAIELTGDDPSANELNALELQTAACREGARHLVLQLFRRDGPEEGDYPGLSSGTERELDEAPRFVSASYFAVDEAGVLFVDGINRNYAPMDGGAVSYPALGDGGTVRIDSADDRRISGAFTFPPEADLSGEFHADVCPAGPTLLDDLFDTLSVLQIAC